MNNLPENLIECPSFGYCDDMKIISCQSDSLRCDIEFLESWCEENKVALNSKKCKILSVKDFNSLEPCGYILKETNCQKDLGVIMSSTISWTANCEKRAEKALTAFYLIERSISNYCSPKTKLHSYCGYNIVPIVSYGSQAWYAIKTELRGMEKVQRKALFWVIGSPEPEYYQKLKVVKLLLLSICLELHESLLFDSLILNRYDLNKDSFVTKFDGTGTKQDNRGIFGSAVV